MQIVLKALDCIDFLLCYEVALNLLLYWRMDLCGAKYDLFQSQILPG